MTVHWNSRIGFAYAVAAVYLLLVIAVVSMIGAEFVRHGNVPLWLNFFGAATALSGWPLAKLTEKVVTGKS